MPKKWKKQIYLLVSTLTVARYQEQTKNFITHTLLSSDYSKIIIFIRYKKHSLYGENGIPAEGLHISFIILKILNKPREKDLFRETLETYFWHKRRPKRRSRRLSVTKLKYICLEFLSQNRINFFPYIFTKINVLV